MKNYLLPGVLLSLKKQSVVVRLALLFTTIFLFQSGAHANGQTLSLDMHDTEISKVLTAIEKQSSYRFLYNSRLQDMGRKLSITVREAGIDEVLNRLFSGSSLTYRKLDNNLIAIRSNNIDEQDIRVTGRVTGSNGEPLQGVAITVKGTA